jgi:hypothetical protein
MKPVRASPAALSKLVLHLGGIRAERLEWVHASLAARLAGYKPDLLDHALLKDRTLLRLWGVRGADLIVHREDAPAQVAAAADEAQLCARFLDANLSIDAERRRHLMEELLPGPFSRSDVARRFERYLHLTGRAPPGAVYQNVLREALFHGQSIWCGGEGPATRYCSVKEWIGEPLVAVPDLGRLLATYLSAFGPAPLADIASCLGSSATAIRATLTSLDAVEVDIEGARPGWILAEDVKVLRKAPDPRHAPSFALPQQDPLLTACPSRDRLGPGLVALSTSTQEAPGTVWVAGKVVATWRREGDVAEVRPIGRVAPAPRSLTEAFAQGEPLLRPRLVR